ncbi:hypothetical protein HMPREF1531_00192 [Propionibacterium sp. oral taxon 192 str. F0372]|uniref:LCP family protein n=1 Tax=Propionibacterium sp. oral taxon 192 TaxID=671222 RepID=UPI000353A4FD|nr:LCP family protein [Propionibacterium sp. oral taxon 192]EPH07143.1 hypothetical protein HMPREF1531_00192 [Propionibacterium sp. oral taxon 192 str. F0372]
MPTIVKSPHQSRWWIVLGVIAVALLAMVGNLVMITARFQRVDLLMPASAGPRTWVIVGLDDRAAASSEITRTTGEADTQPGTRADVILLVTETPRGLVTTAIPRNLWFHSNSAQDGGVLKDLDATARLGAQWQVSPQTFVDNMCVGLRIPVDHLVTIDLQGFVDVVDVLGGVEVEVPRALRDTQVDLDVPAGRIHLDGVHALSYVRSRLGETLIDGQWVPEPEGEQARRERQAQLLSAVLGKVRKSPLSWQQVIWRVSPHLGLATGTGIDDLMDLRSLQQATTLPTEPNGSADEITVETRRHLSELGYRSCYL